MTDQSEQWRIDAFIFLQELQTSLQAGIEHAVARAGRLEGPLLKEQVIPKVHSFLVSKGYSDDQARAILLAEGCETAELKRFASGTPASKQRYPFKKGIAQALRSAKREWWQQKKGLYASCPDFALRSPHKIVFEGKLFRDGSLEAAKSCLVQGIYECTFYRGLPTLYVSDTEAPSAYDFGCLFVYDATPKSAVSEALRRVNEAVRKSWWTELKVFVMVIPSSTGRATEP